jgi:hypothetical protein
MMEITDEEIAQSWMHNMRSGNFEEAWKVSDIVLRKGNQHNDHVPEHLRNIWDGTPLNSKRVLIRCNHGLGDTIQFIRYAPLVKDLATSLIISAQPQIVPLIKTMHGIENVLPLNQKINKEAYDVEVEVMELQHVFRTTIQTIPLAIPYFNVDPVFLSSSKEKINVGLVWKAGEWDERRSIPFELLAPLADVSGVNIHILQGDAIQAGWKQGFGNYPGDFTVFEYARVIKGLDLLVTVDSMPAHLAGALGIPVWNLLHADADWRWMLNRDDSPWYPTMRLFRQEKMGEWSAVIKRVSTELKRLVSKTSNH